MSKRVMRSAPWRLPIGLGVAIPLLLVAARPAASQGDVLWDTEVTTTTITSPINPPTDTFTEDGVTITVDYDFPSATNPGLLAGFGFFQTFTGANGGDTGNLSMIMDPSDDDENQCLQITLGFSPAVEDFMLPVLDVDSDTPPVNSWRDVALVEASQAGAFVAPTTVNTGSDVDERTSADAMCSNMYNLYADFAVDDGTCLVGVNFEAGGGTNANANFTYAGPIDQVKVTYCPGEIGGSEDPIASFISIGDLTWFDSLPVTLAHFRAERDGAGAEVSWTTADETGTVGFEIYAQAASGPPRRVSPFIAADSTESRAPRSYRARLGEPSANDPLLLAELDLRGRKRWHGPFALGTTYGRHPTVRAIDWQTIRGEQQTLAAVRRAGSPAPPDGAQLRVAEDGLHRVSFEELLDAGVDWHGRAVDEIALTLDGEPVALRVESFGQIEFGPGHFLDFVGRRRESLYGSTNVYELRLDADRALRAQRIDTAPTGLGAIDGYLETERVERDLAYSFAAPNGDPWYEAAVLATSAPAAVDLPFNVSERRPGAATLRVDLWGVTDWPGSEPDHHLRLYVNGVELADESFDGLTPHSVDLDVSDALHEGSNTLTVEVAGDTGFDFDLVHVDGMTLTYPRATVGRDDRLIVASDGGETTLTGFSSGDLVAYATDDTEQLAYLSRPRIEADGGGFRATVPGFGSRSRRLLVATGAALHRPTVEPLLTVGPPGDPAADYLIVSHASFIPALDELVRLKTAQGYTVEVVDIAHLWSRYGHSQLDPMAIRRYLRERFAEGNTPLILLVGGDTYDYEDRLGLGAVSFLPTAYVATHPIVRYAPSDSWLVDFDDDGVPDLPIGRLPVRSVDELAEITTKIAAYGRSTTAALASDSGFGTLSDELARLLPNGWTTTRADIDRLGPEAARNELLAALDPGAAIASFVGHSSFSGWSPTGLLTSEDLATLSNAGNPLVIAQWGCWNTYHVAPEFDTMAHQWLLGDTGAVAVLGSATLSRPAIDRRFAPRVFAEMLSSGKPIGQAVLDAKRALADEGHTAPDLQLGWTLLGDPALVVRPGS